MELPRFRKVLVSCWDCVHFKVRDEDGWCKAYRQSILRTRRRLCDSYRPKVVDEPLTRWMG